MGKAALRHIGTMVLVAVLAIVRPAWGSATGQLIVAETEAALDGGDAQEAVTLADSALGEESLSPAQRGLLLLYRGLARQLLGAYDAAMNDFTQALATGGLAPPEQAAALLQRGFLRDGQGRLNQALADYGAVIALRNEGLATALNNRANIYRRQNKLKEARRDYLAALSVPGSKSQYSYYGLGQIAEARHDELAAREFYARAVSADSGYILATDRLIALGGPPDGFVANSEERIILRPPPEKSRPAQTGQSGTMAGDPVKDVRPPPAQNPPPATLVSLSPLVPVNALTLRPALDQASTGEARQVQLGAWRSEAEAQAGWMKAKAAAGTLLDGLSPHVVIGELPGKGRYYRLRVQPGANRSQAEFCMRLTQKGQACVPAKD
ncbi:MAG TPA: tetratricopeptide repeat protein [Rhizomicrobium sp.]|nr:tetratricopeptide repeat protein [Rhizomicrobium sp.]